MDSHIGTPRGTLKRPWLALFVLLLILVLVIWFSPWILLRYAAVFIFLWVQPGLGWVALLPRVLSPLERLAVGLGLSFVVTSLTLLLLSYLPGALVLATTLTEP